MKEQLIYRNMHIYPRILPFMVLVDIALAEGKYEGAYAGTNIYEYWAEGVQNWFKVNAEVMESDGKHNWVNTRDDMRKYDPALYTIIGNYFADFDESPSCHEMENLFQE